MLIDDRRHNARDEATEQVERQHGDPEVIIEKGLLRDGREEIGECGENMVPPAVKLHKERDEDEPIGENGNGHRGERPHRQRQKRPLERAPTPIDEPRGDDERPPDEKIGELANLLIGWAFVIPAGLIYRRWRTFKGALLALAVGSLASVAVAILANWLILIPFFVQLYGGWDHVLPALTNLFPSITQETFFNYYLWISVLPFNLLRCLIASIVTTIVYKHVSRFIDYLNKKLSPEGSTTGMGGTAAVIGCIFVVLLLVLFALLRFFLWS